MPISTKQYSTKHTKQQLIISVLLNNAMQLAIIINYATKDKLQSEW